MVCARATVQCSMISRASLALVALVALAIPARAQPTSVWVDVTPPGTEDPETSEEVEKRYTPELVEELHSAKADALLLYTEFTARAGADLKMFIRNISGFTNETVSQLDPGLLDNAPESCRQQFHKRLKKIEYDAHRAASFSGENHHKFLLGHMIVFRMHLNKSEDYIRKCDRVISTCGIACEKMPKIVRWRRLAAEELHRVRDDLQHSRKAYRDLVAHAHRRLNTLRRQARAKAKDAIEKLNICT